MAIGRERNHRVQTGNQESVISPRRRIDLYWHGANRKKCVLRGAVRVASDDGQAKYVHYRIFDTPDSTELPPVDGVRNGRCEYGLEILITLAYLVYWTGVSIDKACESFAFFTGLELSKSKPTHSFHHWRRTGRWNMTRLLRGSHPRLT